MPYVSDRTWEALGAVIFKLAAQNDRIVQMIQNLGPVDNSWSKRMEEELKALRDALAEDTRVNSSAYKLIQELTAKIENVTATIPPQFRSRLIELTEGLRKNNSELAAGVVAHTIAANEPAQPAPEPVVDPAAPTPEQPPTT